MIATREHVAEASFDLGHGCVDVERADRQITGVSDLARVKRRDVERGVVGPDQTRGRPNRLRPETGTGAEACAGVEGNPQNGNVATLKVLESREASKGDQPGKARDLGRIDRTNRSGLVISLQR